MYWETDNPRKTDRILRKLQKETDPKVLVQIVLTAPMDSVKQAALCRINNWWDLVDILNAQVSWAIKQQALHQIRPDEKNIDVLLCGNLVDGEVEKAVLEKTGGEEKIYSYVRSHSNLAEKAIKYLSNDEYLRHIVTDGRSARREYTIEARKAALKKISEQEELSRVVHMGILASSGNQGGDDRALIAEAAGRLALEENLLWVLNWYSDDAFICKSVINGIDDPALLKKVAENGKGRAKMLAAEKSEGRAALDAVFRNSSAGIENRLMAAARIMKKYGDAGPLNELQKLREEDLNGHILYTTIRRDWEQTEQICLRCGKVGGVEHDSESTRHYGCNFRSEPCRGFDPALLQ